LFVLQFCSDDFRNNSYEWESKTVARGIYMRRPYASMGGEGPKYAPGIMGAIYRSFIGKSRFFNRVDNFIVGIQYKRHGIYSGALPADVEAKYERDSVPVTRMLLTRLRKNYRDVPAVMVNCDGNEAGPNKYWKSIARDAGFIPLSGPSDSLRSLKPDERKNMYYADGVHLSDAGNQLFGSIAGDEIASLRLASLNK
jgi:lysophospholipase L1-like esterase